eukprot:UN1485
MDIQAFEKEDLRVLFAGRVEGRKVELVFQWIQAHIIKNVDSGLLNVPSPLLTRVFQNLGNGLINYNSAQQVVIWPFPFAYAQMNSILVFLHTVITPIVVGSWTDSVWSCALFTAISVCCMVGLDLIAIELENPFGDDANDLPVVEMQNVFNKDLVMLVDPLVWNVPRLLPRTQTHSELLANGLVDSMSLQQYEKAPPLSVTPISSSGTVRGIGKRSLSKQMAWANQGTPPIYDLEPIDTSGFSVCVVYPEDHDECCRRRRGTGGARPHWGAPSPSPSKRSGDDTSH